MRSTEEGGVLILSPGLDGIISLLAGRISCSWREWGVLKRLKLSVQVELGGVGIMENWQHLKNFNKTKNLGDLKDLKWSCKERRTLVTG